MGITVHGLALMGFTQNKEADLHATFQSLSLYAVRGIELESGSLVLQRGATDAASYTVAIGKTANELARALAGDDWAEDEDAWRRASRTAPPYALLQLVLATEHHASNVWTKSDSDGIGIITHDAFPEARKALQVVQNDLLPRIVAGITVGFSTALHTTRLAFLSSERFGVTRDGIRVRDVRVSFSGSGYTSRRYPSEEVENAMAASLDLAARLNMRAASFIHSGLQEDDQLRRFLFLFLSIELETHAVFKAHVTTTDPAARKHALEQDGDRLSDWLPRLESSLDELRANLADRFAWCALFCWRTFTNDDVNTFAKLKRTRDALVHGTTLEPPSDAIPAITDLALRLQGFHLPRGCGPHGSRGCRPVDQC